MGCCLFMLLFELVFVVVGCGLEDLGVCFYFGFLVKVVYYGKDNLDKLVIEFFDGIYLEFDVVFVVIGLCLCIGIVKEVGLDINCGIFIDQYLWISVDNVYVLGDCVEVQGYVLFYVLLLMVFVRVLVKILVGELILVSYGVMLVIIKMLVCLVVVCLVFEELEGDWDIEEEGNIVKVLFCDCDGNLCGYVFIGDVVKEKMKFNKEFLVLMFQGMEIL